MTVQVNDLRLQVERLDYTNKETLITVDILREQNVDQKSELEELRVSLTELKGSQNDTTVEDKEKKKQEKMALMMAKFDAVSRSRRFKITLFRRTPQQGAFSDKDEQLRAVLAKLDSLDSSTSLGPLTSEDLTAIRRQLSEGQSIIRETVDRLRQSQEENENLLHSKEFLEGRVNKLETEYEELLEKTIHEEATNHADVAESIAELRVWSHY